MNSKLFFILCLQLISHLKISQKTCGIKPYLSWRLRIISGLNFLIHVTFYGALTSIDCCLVFCISRVYKNRLLSES